MMKRVEKLRMLQAESAATKSGDALEEQSISDAIPRLQILFLKGNVKDFLLALNENEPAFAKFRNQIPPDVAYHFLVAISRGNDYAQLIDGKILKVSLSDCWKIQAFDVSFFFSST